jgi:cyclomaltodextrinase / maltogenic alpha-amylase / neopullulanase
MPTTTPDWVKDAIFYQIFPDRFARRTLASPVNGYTLTADNFQPWGSPPTRHGFQGGDLGGIEERLDYLVDLGVNAIYLNPIFASASNHRYHTNDYYQVDPLLGGNGAFASLLTAAHARGIRIILDGVFNHASRGFFQFNHLLECGPESPFVDWFHVSGWPLNAYGRSKKLNYAAWWGHAALPKFNTDTTAVREFLWDVATYWLAQGIDGWRLDVPNEIDDDAFWQEFRRRCRAVNPEAYIVGELWMPDAQRWLQGDQFDAQMNYQFTRLAYGFILGKEMDQSETRKTGYGLMPPLNARRFAAGLERLFNQDFAPEIVLAQMNMLGSHDTPRLWTVARGDATAVRLLFLCQMTMPGAPNIYYGDEIGLPGGGDPDCRRAFPWQDQAQWDVALRNDVRRFIRLRHDKVALRRGDFKILLAERGVVVYQRQYGEQTAVIALNASPRSQAIRIPTNLAAPLPEQLVGEGAGTALAMGEKVVINGRSARVWAN